MAVSCDILNFINKRWADRDSHWLDGNCYWFAHILSTRFPFLLIYYLPIEGHFVCGDGTNFYDWRGVAALEEEPLLFDKIKEMDPSWYKRIVRDCIM